MMKTIYFETANVFKGKKKKPTVNAAFLSLKPFGKKVDLNLCTSSVTSSGFTELNC